MLSRDTLSVLFALRLLLRDRIFDNDNYRRQEIDYKYSFQKRLCTKQGIAYFRNRTTSKYQNKLGRPNSYASYTHFATVVQKTNVKRGEGRKIHNL